MHFTETVEMYWTETDLSHALDNTTVIRDD